MRRMLAVVVVSALLLCVGIAGRAAGLEQERADAVAELRALAAQSHAAAQRTDHLEGAVDRAEQETEDRAAVLEVRPAFVAELAALSTALGGAEGKVDTATHLASALSTQQTVLAEQLGLHRVYLQPITGAAHQHAQRVAKERQRRQSALLLNGKGGHRHVQIAVGDRLLDG